MGEAVRRVMVNILHVLVLIIILGVAVRAFVIVLLNMLVQVRGIVAEAELLVTVNIPHVTVQVGMSGMEALVPKSVVLLV